MQRAREERPIFEESFSRILVLRGSDKLQGYIAPHGTDAPEAPFPLEAPDARPLTRWAGKLQKIKMHLK